MDTEQKSRELVIADEMPSDTKKQWETPTLRVMKMQDTSGGYSPFIYEGYYAFVS